MRYNTAAIRDLLNQALSDEEITELCFDHFREIYDNYFTPTLNRHQKTHILIEQVERRGEMDRLLALVREINPVQLTAFADQVLRLPAAPVRRDRRRLALVLGVGLVVLVLGALWLGNRLRSQTLPSLPAVTTCQASPDPVRIALQELGGCPSDLVAELSTAWTAAGATLTPIAGGAEAPLRTLRKPEGYDLIVSGACQAPTAPASLELAFALSSIRNPDDLYQPSEIKLSGPVGDVTAAGSALISFQRGEYSPAEQQIATLPASVKTRELALLRAAALLFEQRYEDAIEAYRELIRQQQDWSAASNNLGVARYNQARLGGETADGYTTEGVDSLTDAIDLAAARHESDVELLAHVNRANVHSQVGNLDKVTADCRQAERLNAQSQLVRLCWLYYYFAMYGEEEARTPTYNADVNRILGTTRDDEIPRVLVLRGDWYRTQDRPVEASAAYTTYLQQMRFHACLAEDHNSINLIPGQSAISAP